MNKLELARPEEAEQCFEIIRAGRAFQQEQGFTQWSDAYPTLDIIRQDLADQKGYLLKIGAETAGYLCVDFDGEPAYQSIRGSWRSEEPYAVVHRMAFLRSFCGQGLANQAFLLVEELCAARGVHYLRVDTDEQNQRMQHVLSKIGFQPCGLVIFQNSEKLGYDKFL